MDEWAMPLRQAAGLAGVPERTVQRWATEGKLKAVRWSKNRRLFRLADVKALAATMKVMPERVPDKEPSQAEVDAMVAEQLANAPEWFHAESRKQARKGPQLTIRVIPERVLFGRAAS